jgi:two-component system, chemotaxis family, chemotaxis protein CheY
LARVNGAPLILLVEDDVAIRETVSECLSGEGYRVHAAAHGAEALAWLARGERPALLLLDLVMPVMNGAELLARVRADAALGELPVLLMTAAITSSASLPRADATLVKPFDLDQLLGAVSRLAPRA